MPFAVNLTPDDAGAQAVERIYAGLRRFDIAEHDLITQYGPCVTILVLGDGVHRDDVVEVLTAIIPRSPSLIVEFSTPWVVPGSPPALALRVVPSAPLLSLHNAVFRRLPEPAVHLHYRPAHWQPHLKLANLRRDQREAAALVARFAGSWQTLRAAFVGCELIRYPPAQPIWQAVLSAPQ